jgi:predicted nucleic acid-binding Zn ribbon protein
MAESDHYYKTPMGGYTCRSCGYFTYVKELIEKHIVTKHEECPHCGKGFVYLSKHIAQMKRRGDTAHDN